MTKLTQSPKLLVLMTMMMFFCVDCSTDNEDDAYGDNDNDTSSDAMPVPTYIIEIPVLVGGGEVVVQPSQNVYEEGQLVTITAVADTGWSFNRWDGDFEAQTESTVTVRMAQDLSIEAYFVQSYSLVVETEGQGDVIISPAKDTYDEGEQPRLEAVAAENWVFDHWAGALTGTANPETLTMNADKTVTAIFVESP
ncbi:MAG: hypothetical protein JXR45_14995 [Deltaproteobacteria bacterium]|nr:hypothetical protein [Deltaproteobacteria bacterium]